MAPTVIFSCGAQVWKIKIIKTETSASADMAAAKETSSEALVTDDFTTGFYTQPLRGMYLQRSALTLVCVCSSSSSYKQCVWFGGCAGSALGLYIKSYLGSQKL